MEIWEQLLAVFDIGVHDNFFALGGHSLVLTQVASRIRRTFGVELPLSALFDKPTVAELAADLESALRSARAGVPSQRTRAPNAIPPLRRGRRDGDLPLSFAQQRLWFVHQLDTASTAYALPEAFRLCGDLRVRALLRSFRELVQRHEILRTTFKPGKSSAAAYQVIASTAEVPLPVVDLRALPQPRREAAARRVAAADVGRAFDLARGPLLRLLLIRVEEREHILLVNQHHIVSDGWSQSIFFRELATIYGAFAAGRRPALPELPVHYADFAIWQRRWLTDEALDASLNYWRRQLDGVTRLRLAADRPRLGRAAGDSRAGGAQTPTPCAGGAQTPTPCAGGAQTPTPCARGAQTQHRRAGSLGLEFPASLTGELKQLSLEAATSLFMTLLSVFMALLARRSGQRDVTVGTPIANRGHREIEDLLGFFVNLLPLRARLGPDEPTFLALLEQIREVALTAYSHQDLPFDRLVEELDPERFGESHPLFQVVLGLQNTPRPDAELPGLAMRPIDLFPPSTRFDLELHLWEEKDGRLAGTFDYRADLFDPTTIARLAGHLIRLARGAVARPRQKLSELPILSRAERHQLLLAWNVGRERSPGTPGDRCLDQIFEARARSAPDAVAVVFESGRDEDPVSVLTYGQLDRRADRLARRLRALGVGPENAVGLCLGRSAEMIVGLLAIVKAGGAYVPLDPAAPRERLDQMVEAARIGVIVDDIEAPRSLADLPGRWDGRGDLAYVMFTSGSTGVPKGVAVTHRSVARLVIDTDYVSLSAADRVAQVSDPSFDAATFEIWAPLLAGARLVICSRELVMAPPKLIAAVRRQGVSVMIMSTALFNAVTLEDPSAWRTVRQVNFGGEAADAQRLREVLESGPPRRLLNVYGPTESTVIAATHRIRAIPPEAVTVPIGSPIAGTVVRVMDTELRPVAAGVQGELCIGGAGLARGYFDRVRLTAERFVPDPLSDTPGRRLFASGDLVRWLANGDLEFLRRLDHQVKIRGFRVEPGEVEAALGRHPAIRQAVVMFRRSRRGRESGASRRPTAGDGQRLVAFVVPAGAAGGSTLSADRLRADLAQRLPDYMVPSQFVFLDALPIARRGKIDRGALGRLAANATSRPELTSAFVRPHGASEEIVAGIWERLLGIEGVGAGDNFFELGGHSLLATRVISRIRQSFGVELPLSAVFEGPTVGALASCLEAAMRAPDKGTPISRTSIRRGPRRGPLSFAQERLWFLHHLDPASPAYNVPWALRLDAACRGGTSGGRLNRPALEASLGEIVRRHRVLRTAFPSVDGSPRLRPIPSSELKPAILPRIDLAALEPADREIVTRRIAGEAAMRPFDLARGPLVRFALLELGGDSQVLGCVMHHIVTDDWSQEIFARELTALYLAASQEARSPPSPLPELEVQYSDFAAWQRQEMLEVVGTELAYWRRHLGGVEPLELPTDRPRPVVHAYRAASWDFPLDARLTRALKELAVDAGASLYMTLLAAFMTLLHRATGQSDIVVGSPIAGRRHRSLESLIGFFINMLAMRQDLSRASTFRDLLRRIRRTALEAYAHQDLPFARLVEELEPDRDLSRNPLFQVSFAFQNAPRYDLQLPGVRVRPLELEASAVRFDLEAHFWEERGAIAGSLVYSADLFDATTIARMARRFRTLLESIVHDPCQRLVELEQLPATERHQLLKEWSVPPARLRRDGVPPARLRRDGVPPARLRRDGVPPARLRRGLHQLFEAQAERTPDATALVCRQPAPGRRRATEQRISYRELDRRANGLASRLRALGVGPESPVAVCMDREPRLVVALLAVLKAGGAYLPLDPDHPIARLENMLEASGARVLVTREPWQQKLRRYRGKLVSAAEDDAGEAERPVAVRMSADNAAYVIYTSGTTGTPKGVVVSHRAIVNHMMWMRTALPFAASDRILQKTPIGFDASACELWAPLLAGSQLILARPGGHRDADYLVEVIQRLGVSMLHVVPYQLGMLVARPGFDRCRTLERVDCGGEALGSELVDRFNQRRPAGAELVNVYGPAEATIHAAYSPLQVARPHPKARASGGQRTAPIGRPIANARIHLLDGSAGPVPIGTRGRLHVGGLGLARGYLGRPASTARSFVPDPFTEQPGSRLYDTGDLARHLPDGRLLFLGRADHQIKLRGLRVELGEIESALEQHPAVKRAVVVAAEHAPGDLRLWAFAVPKAGDPAPAPGAVRDVLRRHLPAAMIPSRLSWLRQLPVTAAGKIDRQFFEALASPREGANVTPSQTGADGRQFDEAPVGEASVPPRTPAEQILAEIWNQVLGGVALPGVHDNFFELGGHSLLATQVVSRIRRVFGLELPLRCLFENPTLAELATCLEAARDSARMAGAGRPASIPRLSAPARAGAPLSFAQERLWFLHRLESDSSAYNMASAWRLDGDLDPAALEAALHEIVRRHDSLRTAFPSAGGQASQVLAGTPPEPLPVIDLAAFPPADAPALALRLIGRQAARPFDLARGPLLRYLLLRLGPRQHILFAGVHHIVSDGWSQGVFRRELTRLYAAAASGRRSPLADLEIQYADFAAWQRRWLAGQTLETQLAYWRRRLDGLPRLRLPADRPRPAIQTYRAASQPLILGEALSSSLVKTSLDAGASLFMTLLAAFLVLVHRYTGQRDVGVGSPIANRNREEIEGLIGFFVNMLVLRGDLSEPAAGELDFLTLVRRAREVSLEAYGHQDLPFEKLVEELDPERDLSQNPLFQVTLTLQNAPDPPVELPGLEVLPLDLEVSSVRFDLELYVWQGPKLELELVYNRDLFDTTTIGRLACHLENLLESAVARPRAPISSLRLHTRAQQQQLFVEWNAQPVPEVPCPLAHQLFERWARRTPEAVALISPATASGQLTFRDLNRRANQLARHLLAVDQAVGMNVPVGVYLERSAGAVIAVLGILKAGGAYLPVDAAYGRERLSYQLGDAGAPLLITRLSLLAELPASRRPEGVRIVCLDRDRAAIRGRETSNIRFDGRDPTRLAYVAYTSGSTGRPKGVMVSHRSLVNAYLAWEESYRLSRRRRADGMLSRRRRADGMLSRRRRADGLPCPGRHLQMASLSFDVFSGDLMRALASGGTLVLCPRELLLVPEELYALIRRQRVDHAEFVPIVANALARHLSTAGAGSLRSMRLLAVGSDTWSRDELAALAAGVGAGTRIVNSYGVTEAAIDSSFFEPAAPNRSRPAPGGSVPVGRPFPGTRLHVLDRQMNPVPAGAPGELHVAGIGPARGYLGRPSLTAAKFVPDTYGETEAGARLYKTGDLARYLADGNLELIGRVDRQIKIRGFRIEPGEIEAVLGRHADVEEAAVVAIRGQDGDERLSAYLVQHPENAEEFENCWQDERVAQWRTVYEDYYRSEDQLQGGTFDVAGWISTYTDQPIPFQEMREWVDRTVERIMSLGPGGGPPRRVLEIGCGTGLLLFRVAAVCQRYLATDFSRPVLESLRRTLEEHPISQVRLLNRQATDFGGVDAGVFDTVVINSVVQYFPGIRYLTRVLRGAVEATCRGGRVLIGDVRSLQLHGAYCASVELCRATGETSLEELARRSRLRRHREEELLVETDYFLALGREFPRVHRVEILPKLGRYHNELTRFRYDVILHLDSGVVEPVGQGAVQPREPGVGGKLRGPGVTRLEWPREGFPAAELRDVLAGGHAALVLTRVPNPRLTTAIELVRRLESQRYTTVAELRESLSRLPARGVEPDDLETLGRELGYSVELSWVNCGHDGDYDAILWRPNVSRPSSALDLPRAELSTTKPWSAYGNDPLRPQAARRLVPRLRAHLRERLPDYMMPSTFTLLQVLPLSASGKVDRAALERIPTVAGHLADPGSSYQAPRTSTEKAVAEIWSDLMAVEHVGLQDGFFELGGHSLLAVRLTARIEHQLGVKLPLASVFRDSTVERLAREIDRRRR